MVLPGARMKYHFIVTDHIKIRNFHSGGNRNGYAHGGSIPSTEVDQFRWVRWLTVPSADLPIHPHSSVKPSTVTIMSTSIPPSQPAPSSSGNQCDSPRLGHMHQHHLNPTAHDRMTSARETLYRREEDGTGTAWAGRSQQRHFFLGRRRSIKPLLSY
jgi:hypothetical protein